MTASIQPNILLLSESKGERRLYESFGTVDTIEAQDLIEEHDVGYMLHYDAVVFAGGTDLDPALYGQSPNSKSYGFFDDDRDSYEVLVYKIARQLHIPMIGICRGAQLLNIMNGGSMVQHVTNHTNEHKMITKDNREYTVNSLHHQMMIPRGHYHLLGYSPPISHGYLGEGDNYLSPYKLIDNKEPEIVWYPKTKNLCIQWHPEYMDDTMLARTYFKELVMEYIIV